MSIWEKAQSVIRPVYKVKEHGFVKSGVIFSVKNGLNKLCEKWIDRDEWASQGVLFLGETPLVQFDGSVSSTTPYLLAQGYGIENADCEELKAIDAAINSPYIDIEHSFEAVKPLLGLLEDGVYLLADAEITPTDGEGRFFWDADPDFRLYRCTAGDYYLGNVRECDIYGIESVDPIYLYPSQSAALFNKERADYYAGLFRTEKEPPRAIAYNFKSGMNVLLDGHHKAAAAAKLGIPLKCLIIIKGRNEWIHKDGTTKEKLRFTDDIYLPAEEVNESLKDIIRKQGKLWSDLPKISDYEDILYRKRQWEEEYLANADKYPDAEDHVLEKHFCIDRRYDEFADYLQANISDKNSLQRFFDEDKFCFRSKEKRRYAGLFAALCLMFRKAARSKDIRLRTSAMAAAALDSSYDVTCDALRYLMIFGSDKEVEELFIGILIDAEKYARYGEIAALFPFDCGDTEKEI